MIYLSGFEPLTINNPDGKIEIKITGLRPGEKLFEELLIGENVFTTAHPQIMQAIETKHDWDKIGLALEKIVKAIDDFDIKLIRNLFVNSNRWL